MPEALLGRARLSASNIRGTVTRGALGALIVNVSGVVLAFGLQILVTRVTGLHNYGIYVYVLAWVTVFSLAVKLGLDTGLVRFLPALLVKQDWRGMKGLLRQSMQIPAAAAVVLGGLSAIVLWVFGSGWLYRTFDAVWDNPQWRN